VIKNTDAQIPVGMPAHPIGLGRKAWTGSADLAATSAIRVGQMDTIP